MELVIPYRRCSSHWRNSKEEPQETDEMASEKTVETEEAVTEKRKRDGRNRRDSDGRSRN